MTENSQVLPVLRITGQEQTEVQDRVAREIPLTIIVNNEELVTLLCSPVDLDYLAVGFLASEGLLKNKADINKILVDEKRGIVRVETITEIDISDDQLFKRTITSGCGRGASFYRLVDARENVKVNSGMKISTSRIISLTKEFQSYSQTYRATGGVHSAALCDLQGIKVFCEDIGRHNAVDKIFGRCLIEEIDTEDSIIVSSGRISSEILIKVARNNVPFLVSKSAPTDSGVNLANELGVTMIGFARGNKMNIYTNSWRVAINGK